MKVWAALLLLWCPLLVQGQLLADPDEVLALGKDSVVQLAIARLRQSGFSTIDPSQFDWLQVRTNGQEIQVAFDRSIQYFPQNTYVIHSAVVNIIYGNASWIPYGTQTDSLAPKVFYTYTAEDKKALEFVLTRISFAPGNRITIKEQADYYSVTESNQQTTAACKVLKLTGEIKDKWHAMTGVRDFDDGFRNVDW